MTENGACVVNVARLGGQARPEKPATAFSPESSDMARRVFLSAKGWHHPTLSTSSIFNHTWSERSLISPVRTNFRQGFPFCFSVPAAVRAREGACGLCSLQAIKGGGVDGLILWREKLHDRELFVQVSQIASEFFLLSLCSFNFVCDLSPAILDLAESLAACLRCA